jgi:hypothetical protein
MDRLKPAGSRAGRKYVVDEKNALSGHSNRFNNKLESLSIALSQADFVRHNISPEMTHKNAEAHGPILSA